MKVYWTVQNEEREQTEPYLTGYLWCWSCELMRKSSFIDKWSDVSLPKEILFSADLAASHFSPWDGSCIHWKLMRPLKELLCWLVLFQCFMPLVFLWPCLYHNTYSFRGLRRAEMCIRERPVMLSSRYHDLRIIYFEANILHMLGIREL